MKKLGSLISLALFSTLFSNLAIAHPGHELSNAYAGFMHPITGWDHLLVMLAIGLWAAKLGGKARWQLPLTFMLVMTFGAVLGMAGFSFASLETLIAASVMAIGLLLIINMPINITLQISLTALFALMHGLAHAAELNHGVSPFIGMLVATGFLHAAGLLLGLQRNNLIKWLQTGLAFVMLAIGAYWTVLV